MVRLSAAVRFSGLDRRFGLDEQVGFGKSVVQVAFYILHFQDCAFGSGNDHDEIARAYTGFFVYLAVGFSDDAFCAVPLHSAPDFF